MAHESKEKAAKRTGGLKSLFAAGRSIRSKLLFWLLLISLVPMAIIALFSYRYSASALQRQSFENLETTLAFQHEALSEYFAGQEKILKNIAETMSLLQQEAYVKLSAVRDLQKNGILSYFEARFQDVQTFAGNSDQRQMLAGLAKNPAAGLSSSLAESLDDWLKEKGFFSLTMLSPDGKVLFSTDKEAAQGTAAREKTAEWQALQKGAKEIAFIDYARSSYNADSIVAYFAAPLATNGQLEGLLLFRLPDDGLDDIVQDTPGLGENSEAYLIGPDGMFRSNSPYFEETTVANPAFLVDEESIVSALSGESGEETSVNYRGDYVFSSYTPVEVYGAKWVLLVEMDQVDAVAAKMRNSQEGGEQPNKNSKERGDYLNSIAVLYGFPDFYLINPDGYIFYSAKHEADYLTNILTGPYSKSNLAATMTKVLAKKELAVSDYSLYEAADDQIGAFMAMPIMDKGVPIMIAALRLPIHQINAVMNLREQFEQTSLHRRQEQTALTQTYLVGEDKLWRSESADPNTTTLLNPEFKADTEAVNEALAGKDGTNILVNGNGESVFSSWSPFKYRDLNWAMISEVKEQDVHKPILALMKIIALTALAAAALIAVVSLLVAAGVTRQVRAIMKVIAKVEKGDYTEQVHVTSQDELGQMAASFNNMTNTVQSLVKSREAEHERLNESIIRLLEEITVLAEGNLSIRATVTEDVIGTLADSLNLMLDELGKAFRRIKDSAEQVGSTANILSSSTEELAAQNNAQSAMINEAVQRINLLTDSIKTAADQADQSADSSRQSSQVAKDGATAVRETSQAMEAIRGNVQNTARAIKRLGESSQEISDFARTINEISDRTSILALNASILAAAAGEEGRGFAVVAEEIQRLAERAAVSTRQIETLIRNILGEITEAGVSMDASIQEVVQGTKLSQNALAKLEEITVRSNQVVELIQSVAAVSKDQADTTAELAGKMGEIGKISLETAQETMGASVSMREMAGMGDDMLQAVAVFKLEADAA